MVKNEVCVRCKPTELFRREKHLQEFFLGESEKFPHQCYQERVLTMVGLKNEEGVVVEDVLTSIKQVKSLASYESKLIKGRQILRVSSTR